jgi:hypothetical protein
MARFDKTLNVVLNAMQVVDEDLCCAVYWDDLCKDTAIVMFMAYPKYGTIHAVMKDLHSRLSSRLGHPVSVCHNHPTDESVLIHGSPDVASVYYSDECCKHNTIRYCMDILDGSEGYRDEYRSMALAAKHIAAITDSNPSMILERLDWDKDPQSQLIKMLLN